MIDKVIDAFEKKDLPLLRSYVVPKKRVQNKIQNYKSVLMLSTHNIKHLLKIPQLEADAIILNLEDGVSTELKPYALELCAFFLSYYRECKKKLIVRVNPLNDGGVEEIQYLNQFQPDGIRIAKIRSIQDIKEAAKLVDDSIELHCSIETKEAWLLLPNLYHPQVKGFYLGILDLFADLGLDQNLLTPKNPTLHYILSHFLVTTKALGIKPISFVYQDYQDLQTFLAFVTLEQQIGYDAKGCISPKQVAIVNKVFKTSLESIEDAKEIIRLFEENKAKGITGFSHPKYGFIDEPIYKGAIKKVQNT